MPILRGEEACFSSNNIDLDTLKELSSSPSLFNICVALLAAMDFLPLTFLKAIWNWVTYYCPICLITRLLTGPHAFISTSHGGVSFCLEKHLVSQKYAVDVISQHLGGIEYTSESKVLVFNGAQGVGKTFATSLIALFQGKCKPVGGSYLGLTGMEGLGRLGISKSWVRRTACEYSNIEIDCEATLLAGNPCFRKFVVSSSNFTSNKVGCFLKNCLACRKRNANAIVVLDESHAKYKEENACEVFRLLERIVLENKVKCDGQAVNASRVVFILTSNEGIEHLASTQAKRGETSGAWKRHHLREAILKEWEGKNVMTECNLSISLEKLASKTVFVPFYPLGMADHRLLLIRLVHHFSLHFESIGLGTLRWNEGQLDLFIEMSAMKLKNGLSQSRVSLHDFDNDFQDVKNAVLHWMEDQEVSKKKTGQVSNGVLEINKKELLIVSPVDSTLIAISNKEL